LFLREATVSFLCTHRLDGEEKRSRYEIERAQTPT
jgi:hypothetical protein